MADQLSAKRFYVSGYVQGVGYRFFARRAAGKLGVRGFVKNLRDGRVEVYAIGSQQQLRDLRAELKRGPSGGTVDDVAEDNAELLNEFSDGFSIEYED
jgi:acylphosphatase